MPYITRLIQLIELLQRGIEPELFHFERIKRLPQSCRGGTDLGGFRFYLNLGLSAGRRYDHHETKAIQAED